MKLSALKNEFDGLSERAQWEWIVEHRDVINEIIVDNDNTSIFLQGDTDASFMLLPKSDCGDRYGVVYLLRALGFTVNHC